MDNTESRITVRCDELLRFQIDELLENEIKKATRNNTPIPSMADVIRKAVKEKYARDVTGEEKDTYMEMMKNSFELTVGGLFNSQKDSFIQKIDRLTEEIGFMYRVVTKYLDIVLLASDFKGEDEALFRKAINIKCMFQELIEEDLMKMRL